VHATLIGLALVDAAVAAHGTYLLVRDRRAEPAPTFHVGSARGTVAPTLVSDGKSSGAGLGLVGRF